MPCPFLIFSQSDYLIQVIQIHILNHKQCRSRSGGFYRSQLIWIYTVCKDRVFPGLAGLGLKRTQWGIKSNKEKNNHVLHATPLSPNAPQCQKMSLPICVPNEDTNQPAHLHNLIRVFIVHMKKVCILWYPNCTH